MTAPRFVNLCIVFISLVNSLASLPQRSHGAEVEDESLKQSQNYKFCWNYDDEQNVNVDIRTNVIPNSINVKNGTKPTKWYYQLFTIVTSKPSTITDSEDYRASSEVIAETRPTIELFSANVTENPSFNGNATDSATEWPWKLSTEASAATTNVTEYPRFDDDVTNSTRVVTTVQPPKVSTVMMTSIVMERPRFNDDVTDSTRVETTVQPSKVNTVVLTSTATDLMEDSLRVISSSYGEQTPMKGMPKSVDSINESTVEGNFPKGKSITFTTTFSPTEFADPASQITDVYRHLKVMTPTVDADIDTTTRLPSTSKYATTSSPNQEITITNTAIDSLKRKPTLDSTYMEKSSPTTVQTTVFEESTPSPPAPMETVQANSTTTDLFSTETATTPLVTTTPPPRTTWIAQTRYSTPPTTAPPTTTWIAQTNPSTPPKTLSTITQTNSRAPSTPPWTTQPSSLTQGRVTPSQIESTRTSAEGGWVTPTKLIVPFFRPMVNFTFHVPARRDFTISFPGRKYFFKNRL